MDPIEKAIRTALEKGDAEDPEFRGRVYRSVEAALDRVIKANPQLTVERVITRRKQLQQKIVEIESEFVPAREPEPTDSEDDLDTALLDILEHAPANDLSDRATPSRPSEPPRYDAPGGRREPGFSFDDRFTPSADHVDPAMDQHIPMDEWGLSTETPRRSAEPEVDFDAVPHLPESADSSLDFPAIPPAMDNTDMSSPVPQSPPDVISADRVTRHRERRRPFVGLFVTAALLALGVGGLMFAFQTELLKSADERDTSVHNPPVDLGTEDYTPSNDGPPPLGEVAPSQQQWITVFSPGTPATVSAPSNTRAEAMQDESGQFLRIRSSEDGSAVSFDVGPGILEQLAGRKAVFNITARGEEGQTTEMSVACNFGDLGDCGRRRYEVGYETGDYLFEVTFPDKRAGSSGTIAINSDFSGQGRSIDIYGIRVTAE
ncbi:MAG: hypothetical protein M9944_07050 [Rhizobiaceae bacterium]|nr:hypothetical protein [Rhizobiaceae bacterium]